MAPPQGKKIMKEDRSLKKDPNPRGLGAGLSGHVCLALQAADITYHKLL